MITISDTVKLEIPEIEKDTGFLLNELLLSYGVNGILPTFYFTLENYTGSLDLKEISIRLVVDGTVSCDCKAIITDYTVEETAYTFKGYLFNSYDLIYKSTAFVYNSLDEAIRSIWKDGKIDIQIPNISDANLAQCRQININYLTKILKVLSSDSTFYYGMFNDISEVSLTKDSVDKDFVEDANGIALIVAGANASASTSMPLINNEGISASSGQFSTAVFGNKIMLTTNDNLRMSNNFIESSIKLGQGGCDIEFEYTDPKLIKLGDVCKVRLSESVVAKMIALSTTVHLQKQKLICRTRTNYIG